jgi:hypothetical protein
LNFEEALVSLLKVTPPPKPPGKKKANTGK